MTTGFNFGAHFEEAFSEKGSPGTGGFGRQKLKNDAIAVALTIVEEKLDTWEDIEALLMAYADISEDGVIDDDEQEYYSALVSQTVHALAFLGSDYKVAVKAFQREDDGLLKSVMKAAVDAYSNDQREESDVIKAYVGSKGVASLYESCSDQEWGDGLVAMNEGNFDSANLDGLDRFEEKMVKKIRGGKVVWVKKRIGRAKRMSPAQKAALKKARRKANTGAAKRHRAKSIKIRTKRNL